MNKSDLRNEIISAILGILLLIIAIFSVSYALFKYAKFGEVNNTIKAGPLNINYVEGNGLTLTNAYPMSDEDGIKQQDFFAFTIFGNNISEDTDIVYDIVVVKGDTLNQLQDASISVYIVGSGKGAFSSSKPHKLKDISKGEIIGTGVIAKNSKEKVLHSYQLKMWINDDTGISNDKSIMPDKKIVYTPSEFSLKSFSIKVDILVTSGIE